MSVLKKRYKYNLVVYLIFYIISLLGTGTPNIYYLTPVKVMPIIVTIAMGDGVYYIKEQKKDVLYAKFLMIKRSVIWIPMLILSGMFSYYMLNKYGIDITPFIGI